MSVVKPSKNPASDVDSYRELHNHFDMCYPPPYMGLDLSRMRYEEYIPASFFLYCRHAPCCGQGRTRICDTTSVHRSLPSRLQKRLGDVEVSFEIKKMTKAMHYGGSSYDYKLVMEDPETPGRPIIRFCEVEPADGKTFRFKSKPDDLDMSEDGLQELLASKYSDPKHTLYHSYRTGDLMIVNNHRTVHGREGFSRGPVHDRELWRFQIIPEQLVEGCSSYWESSIFSQAARDHLEHGRDAWARAVYGEAQSRGLRLDLGAATGGLSRKALLRLLDMDCVLRTNMTAAARSSSNNKMPEDASSRTSTTAESVAQVEDDNGSRN